MPQIKSACCVYGDPCFSVCINPKCRKFGMICQKGYQIKQQCYLFHHQCPQIKWSQLQKIATQNTYTSTEQFLQFRLKIQKLFISTIQKIKQQQQKFRIWVKTYGHSIEVMKFIKLINDKNYQNISGSVVSPVIDSYFKDQNNISRPPHLVDDDIVQIQKDIEETLENITGLYLKTTKLKAKHQYSMAQLSSIGPHHQEKNLSKSQRYQNSPNPNVRGRHQSQMKISQQNSAQYNQRHERLEGSIFSQNSQTNNKPRQQMMIKFNSKIYRHVQNIKNLFTSQKPINFKLLYRASQQQFSIQKFHQLCDNIPNTLVLIQTQFSKIIGGFTSLQWKSNKKQWVADKNKDSFIFSLSLNEKYQLNLPQFAVSCNGEKGPIFGCCDICIVDKANKQKSSAQFPISYNINKKYHRGDQASFAFTGHPKGQFKIKDWQVFKVDFQ